MRSGLFIKGNYSSRYDRMDAIVRLSKLFKNRRKHFDDEHVFELALCVALSSIKYKTVNDEGDDLVANHSKRLNLDPSLVKIVIYDALSLELWDVYDWLDRLSPSDLGTLINGVNHLMNDIVSANDYPPCYRELSIVMGNIISEFLEEYDE